MAFYESTFIARQDCSSQEVEQLTDAMKKIVEDKKGKVVKDEYWGLRTLAYKVNKNRKGHYVMLGIEANNDVIDELNHNYKINESIIRNLTIKVHEIDKNPSHMLKNKE